MPALPGPPAATRGGPGRRGRDKDELATASGAAQVYPREVEAARRGLQARGFALSLEVARAIADAFLADAVVRAPAPRFRVGSRA